MAPQTSLIGQTIGQYKILSELGRGGMGVVYLANQESVDRQVAVKILATHLVEDESFVKRFVQEGRTAASLSHPNIVTVHEIGQDDGNFFIAMEAVQGRSISALLQKSGKLPLQNALDITRQAAEALSSAHEKGVIHRDIKPENIMLDKQGRVKLMDFGLAKAIAGAGSLTATGTLLGTPKYMSPEQCQSGTLGPPSDIYSLGVVLYEMLSGELPYESDTPLSLMIKISQEPFPRLPGVNVSIPAAAERIIRNMTARAQENRYASGRALVRDLEACLKDPNTPIQSTWTDGEDEGVQDLGLGQDLVAGLMDTPAVETDSGPGAAPIAPRRRVAIEIPPPRVFGIAAVALVIVAGAVFAIPRLGGALPGIGSELSGLSTLDGVGPGEVINNGKMFEDYVGAANYFDRSSGESLKTAITADVDFDGETYQQQDYYVGDLENSEPVLSMYWVRRDRNYDWYWKLGDAHPRQSFRFPVRDGQKWTDTYYIRAEDSEMENPIDVHIRATAEQGADYPPGTTRYDVVVDYFIEGGEPDYANAVVKYWWTPYIGIVKGRVAPPDGPVDTTWLIRYAYRGRNLDLKALYETGALNFE